MTQTKEPLKVYVQISGSENINIKDLNLYKIYIINKNKKWGVDLKPDIIKYQKNNILSFTLDNSPNWEYPRKIDIEIELGYKNNETQKIEKK